MTSETYLDNMRLELGRARIAANDLIKKEGLEAAKQKLNDMLDLPVSSVVKNALKAEIRIKEAELGLRTDLSSRLTEASTFDRVKAYLGALSAVNDSPMFDVMSNERAPGKDWVTVSSKIEQRVMGEVERLLGLESGSLGRIKHDQPHEKPVLASESKYPQLTDYVIGMLYYMKPINPDKYTGGPRTHRDAWSGVESVIDRLDKIRQAVVKPDQPRAGGVEPTQKEGSFENVRAYMKALVAINQDSKGFEMRNPDDGYGWRDAYSMIEAEALKETSRALGFDRGYLGFDAYSEITRNEKISQIMQEAFKATSSQEMVDLTAQHGFMTKNERMKTFQDNWVAISSAISKVESIKHHLDRAMEQTGLKPGTHEYQINAADKIKDAVSLASSDAEIKKDLENITSQSMRR